MCWLHGTAHVHFIVTHGFSVVTCMAAFNDVCSAWVAHVQDTRITRSQSCIAEGDLNSWAYGLFCLCCNGKVLTGLLAFDFPFLCSLGQTRFLLRSWHGLWFTSLVSYHSQSASGKSSHPALPGPLTCPFRSGLHIFVYTVSCLSLLWTSAPWQPGSCGSSLKNESIDLLVYWLSHSETFLECVLYLRKLSLNKLKNSFLCFFSLFGIHHHY